MVSSAEKYKHLTNESRFKDARVYKPRSTPLFLSSSTRTPVLICQNWNMGSKWPLPLPPKVLQKAMMSDRSSCLVFQETPENSYVRVRLQKSSMDFSMCGEDLLLLKQPQYPSWCLSSRRLESTSHLSGSKPTSQFRMCSATPQKILERRIVCAVVAMDCSASSACTTRRGVYTSRS